MITEKDSVEQFKRDCKSIDYYNKKIVECNEQIEVIDLKLTGMNSKISDEPKLENNHDPYKNNKIALQMEQDKIVAERDDYIKKVSKINELLMKITDINDKRIIEEIYINKRNQEQIAKKYHFASRPSMIKRINRAIKKILKK